MKNIISSVKNKILPKYLSKDIEKNVSKNIQNYKDKSTDINILLNRVREDNKKESRKKILYKQKKGRLEKLDREVQFIRLELDKLSSKEEKTPLEKEKIIELEEKINTRRKTFFIK